LPSVRKLAEMLGISTTPVEWAYQQLIAEGYIYSQPRRGYHVRAMVDSDHAMQIGQTDKQTAGQAPVAQTTWSDHQAIRPARAVQYDFHMSRNDFSLFPIAKWHQYVNRI
ncbi:GntR family transcriptional regulator, partial [Clostridioides difficile]